MAVVAGGWAVNVSTYLLVMGICLCSAVERIGVAVYAREVGIVCRNQMAIGADRTVVRDCKGRVVKSRAEPRGSVVASCARSWVAGGDVIGNIAAECCRALPGGNVAPVAIRIRGGEVVIAIDMALRASRAGQVESGEGPAGGAVIEFSVSPFGDGMTRGASRCGRGKTRFDVVGDIATVARRAIPSGEVAAHAIVGIQRVVIADVA